MTDRFPAGVHFMDEAPFGSDLMIRRFQLENGLRILLMVDRSAPIFSLHTWFRVGSRNEREGRTGIAHLFEHLMFKATRNHPEGEFDRLMEARGACTNAATWVDWTHYKETLGRDDLELALDLESDRMVHLLLDHDQLEAERGVVENERRMAVEDSLSGTMSEHLYVLAFERHPYRWPTIGWMEDIKAISLDECIDFYRTYYAPNNAILTLVGDIDELRTLELVQERYGSLSSQPIPHYEAVAEPPQTGERRKEIRWPTPTSKLLVGYRCPEMLHPDATPLSVLSVVLFSGRASRLYRRLVIQEELASDVEGGLLPLAEPGLFEIGITLDEGLSARMDTVERILDEEIARVCRDGITAAELEKARNTLEADFYKQLRTGEDRGYAMGFYEVLAGDYRWLLNRVPECRAVTADQVVEAARRYFHHDQKNVVIAHPDAPEPPREEVVRSPVAAGPEYDLEIVPGVRLVGEARHDLPVVIVNAYVQNGGFSDPPGLEGLAYFVGELLLGGADGMSREDINEAIEALGGTLSVHASHENTVLSGQVLSRNLEPFVALLARILTRPTFDRAEIETQKKLQLQDILSLRDADAPLARRFFRMALFGGHPLARPLLGYGPGIGSITAADVGAFYDRHYVRGNILIAAAGDVEPSRLRDLLAPMAEALPFGLPSHRVPPIPSPRPGRHLVVVDKPDRTQNHFVIGHPCIPAAHPDYFPLHVGTTAFGGTFTSRLMEEIRTRRGWTYEAHAVLPRTRLGDAFYIYTYTAPPETREAIELCLEMYETFIREGLGPDEIEAARSFLVNQHPFQIDTAEKRVGFRVESILKELPESFFSDYQDHVRQVTPDRIHQALRSQLRTRDLTLSIVCTARDLEQGLRGIPGLDSYRTVSYDRDGPLEATAGEALPASGP